MNKFIRKIFFCFLIFTSFFVFLIYDKPTIADTSLTQREAELRKELEKIEAEQAALQKSLDSQKNQTATFQRDVNILTDQIKQAELQIRKKKLEIEGLSKEINLKNKTVTELEDKLIKSQISLGELVRKNDELDKKSIVEVLLTNQNLSDFFEVLDSYNTVQGEMENLLKEIRDIIGLTETEKEALEKKQNAELDAKKEIESKKSVVDSKKQEKSTLLTNSKKTESEYQKFIAEKQAKASAIRAALFQLRDSKGISFGDALKYANHASQVTGVRTAFILAILKQESDLGKNVGTCNRAGDPPEKKYTAIMPGPNDGHRSYRDDQTVFLRITKALGLDPNTTPLSCPWGSGWGGAMGPSQFIPTTWAGYESRIANAVGVSVPNPWNPEHAIMATAIYMSDLGAVGSGYTAEWTAAMKYYAGGNWNRKNEEGKYINAFYGNGVMAHAAGFQKQIDFLKDVE